MVEGRGDLLDSAGPNNGVAIGTVSFAQGAVGQGWALSGGNAVDVPNPVAGGLESPTGFTVVFWLYQNSYGVTSSFANLRTNRNASGFTLENQFNTPGTFLFAVHMAGDFQLLSAPGWSLGRFYHVAATFDAATHTMSVYRAGELVATRTDLPTGNMTADASSSFRMGQNIVTGGSMEGILDEIQVFNRALTPAEIAALISACPGDLDIDRIVSLTDLSILLAHYGSTTAGMRDGDMDGDADVDLTDLATMLAIYGSVCD